MNEPQNPTPAEMIMLLNMILMLQGKVLITAGWDKLVWGVRSYHWSYH